MTDKFTKDLELVVEQASEVIHSAMKMMRFGIHNGHPDYYCGEPNIEIFTREVGELLHCIDRLGLDPEKIKTAKYFKRERLKVYGPEGAYLKEQKAKYPGRKRR